MRLLPFVSLACLFVPFAGAAAQEPQDAAGRLLETPPRAETPREAVVGFYRALGSGDGIGAEWFVVREKRGRGAFMAAKMERFYSDLAEPLRLISVEPDGPAAFRVRYTFLAAGTPCQGRARVQARRTDEGWKIASIVAPSGC